MGMLSGVLSRLIEQETQRIEAELAELVGTGMDLAVVREPPALWGAEVRSTLLLRRIPGGSLPDYACTVYRVSTLGAFAQA